MNTLRNLTFFILSLILGFPDLLGLLTAADRVAKTLNLSKMLAPGIFEAFDMV